MKTVVEVSADMWAKTPADDPGSGMVAALEGDVHRIVDELCELGLARS
ncbi:hypothetical protein [Micromonospora echinaurantiaca]